MLFERTSKDWMEAKPMLFTQSSVLSKMRRARRTEEGVISSAGDALSRVESGRESVTIITNEQGKNSSCYTGRVGMRGRLKSREEDKSGRGPEEGGSCCALASSPQSQAAGNAGGG